MKLPRTIHAGGANLPASRGGFVLIAVMIVVMLAAMVAVSLLFRLRAEETAAAAGAGSEQAWDAAMSGLYEAMRVTGKLVPGELDWQDDPATFRERLVIEDGTERWYFSVYAAPDSDRPEIRFGPTDEAGKLNLNQATEEMLGRFPRLTPYLVQGLLDFLDADNAPRPEGAEQEYYDGLPQPYTVLNSPLTTLGELLLVRGFTPALVFGEDANLNFQLDPNEDDADEQFPPDNKDGKRDGGLRELLTVGTYDLNEDTEGFPRMNLNDADTPLNDKDYPPEATAYLAALRRNKVKINHPADLLEAKAKLKDEQGREVEMASGIGKAELGPLLDYYSGTSEYHLPGLINVNTASAPVLATLPGVDETLADAIVSARRNLRPEQRRTPAWLYQEDLVDAEQFKKIAPLVTARSYQYHVQVVGYGVPSGRYRVLEAVIDMAPYEPAIVYLRDLTRLGLPFRIETESELTGEAAAQARAHPRPLQPREVPRG